ncbi:MAG TPA: LysR family transcriptional regulator [Paenarthrobacter sp.]|nr:LysR family transcriptional regulator [Paenarthrobacter sp.]
MSVDARHLRVFLAIAEEGGFSAAADVLRVSQPALSRTLRQLETHLGSQLFERSTHHVAITEAGKALLPRAAAAIAALDDALNPSSSPAPLRLGYAWSALGRRTGPLLRRWHELHPDTRVELRRVDDRFGGLASGRTHLALVRGETPLTGGPAGLGQRELAEEPRVAALPTGHPLATRSEVALADLSGDVVVVNTLTGITNLDLWPEGIRPDKTLATDNTDDWLLAIASSRGIGVSGISTAETYQHSGVTYKPLVDAPPVTVSLAWIEPRSHPAMTEFMGFLESEVPKDLASLPAPGQEA